ncbi:MAG TPA: hypothetical protein VHW74_01510 [Mycobacteriales bacterium]|nr:hypothetical protein [Mycobacteriales bacterium]
MRSIRFVVPALALVALAGLVPLAASAEPTVPAAGHLAFITASGALDLVAVLADGTTTDPAQIAPVTTVTAPRTVEVNDLVVSADKNWLGWQEETFKPDKTYGRVEVSERVAVRNMYSGKTITVPGAAYPLGFSGSQLIVEGARTARLVLKPTPHYVSLHEGNAYPVATYQGGVVDVDSTGSANSDVDTERLRLTTFAGKHTVLHTYVVGLDYRAVTANIDAVSPDGKHLLVERGNHQDFDGLGPSSLFDEYAMTGSHTRRQLGHYGTNKADWRLVDSTFVGKQDTPWLALHGGYIKISKGHYAVNGVVVKYAGGKWQLVQPRAIAVAGNSDGYAVIQPGKWQEVKNSPDGEFDAVPTAPAILQGPGGTHTLSKVEGSQILWVTQTDPSNPEGT